MTNTIFITFIFCVILGIMMFSGMVKTVKFTWGNNPSENTYQSEDVRRTQSELTADLKDETDERMDRVRAQQDKNRQNMDRMKAQMERNRR